MKHFKKLLCLVLALIMMFSMTASVFAEPALPFTDVSEGSFYYDALAYLYDMGVCKGKTDTRFAPADSVTRAEFVTFLYRIIAQSETLGSTVSKVTYKKTFSDVPDGQFYSIPVTWASGAGIVKGYESGKFGPADKITREQMATMLLRADIYWNEATDGSVNTTIPEDSVLEEYSDKGAVSSFAKDGVKYCVNKYIIRGRAGSNDNYLLAPQEKASRAETVVMLYRWW